LSKNESLKNLRNSINGLDGRLAVLLNKRAELVRRVGLWKKRNNTAVHVPGREEEIIRKVKAGNRGPLPASFLEKTFRGLIKNYREWEKTGTQEPAEADLEFLRGATVSIIGLGLMGFSAALKLRELPCAVKLKGYDSSTVPMIVKEKVRLCRSLESALDASIIVLATPVRGTLDILKKHAKTLKKSGLVIDLGSTKAEIMKAASGLKNFAGGHPFAGKAVSGAEAAEAGLFEGRDFFLTGGKEPLAKAEKFARLLGSRPVRIGAGEHDRVLALASHLPQFISTSLALLASRASAARPGEKHYFGPAFKDMTRLAASDYAMWRDIFLTNRENIIKLMDGYTKTLKGIKKSLASGDFEKEFREAKKFIDSR
jgi:prephenate dehydrogenase/chorismate mutase